MSTVLRRLLPASLLLVAALAVLAAPSSAARPKDDKPNEMGTATPPPYHPNLNVSFGPFALGTTRSALDRISSKPSDPKIDTVRYVLQDGEVVTVTFADGKAAAIVIDRSLQDKRKAILATSDGIRLGAPIKAVLPLYGPPADVEPGSKPGYTLYAWRMAHGRSIVFQAFLGEIVEVDMLPPKPYPPGVTMGDADGRSEANAVTIVAPTHDVAVEAEYNWLTRVDCGAAGFRFAFEKNLNEKGKQLEAIGLYCGGGDRVYLFDVSKVPKGK